MLISGQQNRINLDIILNVYFMKLSSLPNHFEVLQTSTFRGFSPRDLLNLLQDELTAQMCPENSFGSLVVALFTLFQTS